jgi:endonuclease/exonuclease/phosphatase family metal-dependent hydrolase
VALSFDYASTIEYGQWTNQAGSNLVNQLFYNNEKLGYKGVTVIPSNHLRDLNAYTLYHRPSAEAGADTVFFTFIVVHLKAGDGSANENQRNQAAEAIMDWVEQQGSGQNIFLMGDLNLSDHTENTFQTLVSNSNPSLRFYDPINKETGWSGFANAIHHTQSTRTSDPDCGSVGGMDDRFDWILVNEALKTGMGGVSFVPGSYEAVGNDGNSYNTELKCSGNTSVPGNVCVALRQLSDHLPVLMEVALSPTVGLDTRWTGPTVRLIQERDQVQLPLIGEMQGSYQVEMMDLMGRKWASHRLASPEREIRFSTTALPRGIYLLRLSDEDGRTFQQKWMLR